MTGIHKSTDGWFRGEIGEREGFLPACSVSMLFEYPEENQNVYSKKVLLKRFQNETLTQSAPQSNKKMLEHYAATYFTNKDNVTFSNVPIESSLHTFKSITDSVYASEMFVRIMKWMGDYPVGGANLFNTTVDMLQKVIFLLLWWLFFVTIVLR